MPIRFRCVYCNQLLGISRRKAGKVVQCTTCKGQLIVPDPNEAATDPSPPQDDSGSGEPQPQTEMAGGNFFEKNDFEALFEPYRKPRSSAVASAPAPAAQRERSGDGNLLVAPPAAGEESPPALVLTRARLTVVSVLLVVALGLTFGVGLVVGMNLR